ncbi:MAG: hypothetical protein ACO3YZ_07530 [Candidatus Nanopelagicaceae bacterium]
METKIWEYSFAKEDVETLLAKPITDGEWNIIVDELYNNDELYNALTTLALDVARDVLNS